jgi:hypothetical protein
MYEAVHSCSVPGHPLCWVRDAENRAPMTIPPCAPCNVVGQNRIGIGGRALATGEVIQALPGSVAYRVLATRHGALLS